MPVTSLVTLTFSPEAASTAEPLIQQSLELTRAFAGNLGVDVLCSLDDETVFVLVERWVSEEADAAYRAYRAGLNTPSLLGPLLAEAPSVAKYTLTSA